MNKVLREEKKFLISIAEFRSTSAKLEKVMRQDPHNGVHGYMIRSLYFDTPYDTDYTVLTGTVMTVIGNNIALSLGMVGALSIVRFRTAIKDSRDTIYIFWTVIAGICCGVGDYLVAAIGSAVTFLILLILGLIKNDNRMLIIIRGSRSRQSAIQAHMFTTFKRKAILRVRNTDEDNVEFIYEVSVNQLKRVEDINGNQTDALYKLGGIEYVNIVMQNDEVSN